MPLNKENKPNHRALYVFDIYPTSDLARFDSRSFYCWWECMHSSRIMRGSHKNVCSPRHSPFWGSAYTCYWICAYVLACMHSSLYIFMCRRLSIYVHVWFCVFMCLCACAYARVYAITDIDNLLFRSVEFKLIPPVRFLHYKHRESLFNFLRPYKRLLFHVVNTDFYFHAGLVMLRFFV